MLEVEFVVEVNAEVAWVCSKWQWCVLERGLRDGGNRVPGEVRVGALAGVEGNSPISGLLFDAC